MSINAFDVILNIFEDELTIPYANGPNDNIPPPNFSGASDAPKKIESENSLGNPDRTSSTVDPKAQFIKFPKEVETNTLMINLFDSCGTNFPHTKA